MFRKFAPLLLIPILIFAAFAFYRFHQYQKVEEAKKLQKVLAAQAKFPPDYLIILIGDSMTEYLGNATELRGFLGQYYPGKSLDIYNYGFGSTNILSLPDRLTNWTDHGRPFKPILDYEPQIIVIESFGYNPLSDYPLQEGLKKQNEILDESIKLIKDKKPNTKIVFLATISPNKKYYGAHLLDLSDEVRAKWVQERITYIKNHIDYAKSHGIPVINVFEKSLDIIGDGNLQYVEDKNYIHPSPKGIILIQKEIANFIFQNHLLN